jgi:hypothetical protein
MVKNGGPHRLKELGSALSRAKNKDPSQGVSTAAEMRRPTRGDSAIMWIEKFCVYPNGAERGQRVSLRHGQKEIVRRTALPDRESAVTSQPIWPCCTSAARKRCAMMIRCRSSTPTASQSGPRPVRT